MKHTLHSRAALRTTQVSVASLRPFPGNPRIMSASKMHKLLRSIQRFGLVEPLVVRGADWLVIGGNQRLEAARTAGLRTVPAVLVELSDAEAKALNLALNKIQGEWDLPKLGELLEELADLPNLDQTLTGFDPSEIDSLLAQLERDAAPSPREESFPQAAEALQDWSERAPTRVSHGQLWRLGRHRLFCGDSLLPGSLEKLTGGAPVDMTLTDPPYGLDYQSSQAAPGRRKKKITNDESSGFEAFLDRALRPSKGR